MFICEPTLCSFLCQHDGVLIVSSLALTCRKDAVIHTCALLWVSSLTHCPSSQWWASRWPVCTCTIMYTCLYVHVQLCTCGIEVGWQCFHHLGRLITLHVCIRCVCEGGGGGLSMLLGWIPFFSFYMLSATVVRYTHVFSCKVCLEAVYSCSGSCIGSPNRRPMWFIFVRYIFNSPSPPFKAGHLYTWYFWTNRPTCIYMCSMYVHNLWL